MEMLTSDFSYHLPEERIALFPTQERDQSKLLIYRKGTIEHTIFKSITAYIPKGSLLVFNNSKVIPARLRFKRDSGSTIEIFLLNLVETNDSQLPLHSCQWKCTIGNKKKWKRGVLKIVKGNVELIARLADDENSIVEFQWSDTKTWDEVLQIFGDTPLPPYIKRATTEADRERYQTVYSSPAGAVAAPTAGLHFTPELLAAITANGSFTDFVTLHVGAGTFRPIKTKNPTDHIMHEERIIFSKANIHNMMAHGGNIIHVGTTSCRSLESLYWFGVKLFSAKGKEHIPFVVDQHFPYQQHPYLPTRAECLKKIHDYLVFHGKDDLVGLTSIYIYPGYTFRMTDGLITNFHQPNSTLLLLIAALVGSEWKKIYSDAIQYGYRFLSYGDSSFLMP
jgi:S-adenosylmethionine:tRNA ribosyltransferase-isomerase